MRSTTGSAGRIPHWLTARPVAHRGLHDHDGGIVENTVSAFEAAIARGFTVETDLQCTRDNEPVIFHDPVLERLTTSEGRLDALTAEEFKTLTFSDSDDPMLDLPDFLKLINGRTPLLIEIKSRGEFNPAFAARIAEILRGYKGEYAVMSFDPRMVRAMREHLPKVTRGLISCAFEVDYWGDLSAFTRFKLRHLVYFWQAGPDFIAYSINALPAIAPLVLKAFGVPLLSWTVNSLEKLKKARKYADNVIFENIDPTG